MHSARSHLPQPSPNPPPPQSGGFTTDILTSLDPQALLGGGAGMSADEVKAAMRAAEDEGDVAAAAAVEREAAAEMEEFVKVVRGRM